MFLYNNNSLFSPILKFDPSFTYEYFCNFIFPYYARFFDINGIDKDLYEDYFFTCNPRLDLIKFNHFYSDFAKIRHSINGNVSIKKAYALSLSKDYLAMTCPITGISYSVLSIGNRACFYAIYHDWETMKNNMATLSKGI